MPLDESLPSAAWSPRVNGAADYLHAVKVGYPDVLVMVLVGRRELALGRRAREPGGLSTSTAAIAE